MSRYAKYFPRDTPMEIKGDPILLGIDMVTKPAALRPGYGQDAQNKRFGRGSADTRKGTVTPVHANIPTYGTIYGGGIYSDPNTSSEEWLMLAVSDGVWFVREGRYPVKVDLAAGLTIDGTVNLIQCFDVVVLFRGFDETPLVWEGNWYGEFTEIEQSASGSTNPIPNSDTAVLFGPANRLLVKASRDEIAVSDSGDFTRYDEILDEFRINSGSDDSITVIFPYDKTTILIFKDQSIFLVENIFGDLSTVKGGDVSREGKGSVAQFGVQKWGSKVVFFANDGIWALKPAENANNGLLEVEQMPVSYEVTPLIDRINWSAASGIVSEQLGDEIIFAVPIDGSTYNNAALVLNRVTGVWAGLDTWDSDSGFRMDRLFVTDYLGRKRIYAVDFEHGRVCVMYEGTSDTVGTTDYPISDYFHSRGYAAAELGFQYLSRVVITEETQNPSLTITAYTDGVNEGQTLAENRTRNRLKYWTWGKADYDITDADSNHGVRGRQDYTFLSTDGAPSDHNIDPNLKQQVDDPYPIRDVGRSISIKIANSQGICNVHSIAVDGMGAGRSQKLAA